MPAPIPLSFNDKITSVLGAIRSTGIPAHADRAPLQILPFVTFSQLPGAGGKAVADALAQRLNATDPADRPWEIFDRDMLEQAATDEHISREIIESLEESSHTWLSDFFSGMSSRDQNPSDLRVLHKLACAIRGLAQAGRVILLGWGSGFVTSDMPGGTHVWIIADSADRTANLARALALSISAADVERVNRDSQRAAFYQHYFPNRPVAPDQFTITLNASRLSTDQMVAALAAAILAGGHIRRVPPPSSRFQT